MTKLASYEPDALDEKKTAAHKDFKPNVSRELSHPFVQGMANAGAMLGRDIGVLALRAVEVLGPTAVLYWTADRVPQVIRDQMPEEMKANLHGAMVVPAGASVPGITFTDAKVRTASRVLMDGSTLIGFERAAANDEASA